MIHHLDAIVFDFDGVLVESTDVKTRAFAALYTKYGPDIEQQVIHYHLAHGGISRYRKFQYFQEVLLGVPYTETDGQQLAEHFSHLVVDAIVQAPYVAGAQEFLKNHAGKLAMFVASGTPDEELHSIIERRGMRPYFVSVHGTPSTKGQIINRLIQAHALDPSRVLMVGDALADLEGAQQAGTAFLGRVIAKQNPFPPGIDTVADLTELTTRL